MINEIKNKLLKRKIRFFNEIPEEIKNEKEIINICRTLGLRKQIKKGFDVLENKFFVEELVKERLFEKRIVSLFETFDSYYEFLDGDIYENAYYFQYNFSEELVERYKLNLDLLNTLPSYECSLKNFSEYEIDKRKLEFEENAKTLRQRKKWLEKFFACKNASELKEQILKQEKSKDKTKASFYLWNYIKHHGKKSCKTIMKILSDFKSNYGFSEKSMCFVYGTEAVLKECDFSKSDAEKKRNQELKKFAKMVDNFDILEEESKFFCKQTHFYCIATSKYIIENGRKKYLATLYDYFESFEEFAKKLNYDLSDCDLFDDFDLNLELKHYKINKTKLPLRYLGEKKTIPTKLYNREKNIFEVKLKTYASDFIIFEKSFRFNYFYEFYSFLDGDLKDANLIFCDKLENLPKEKNINLLDARVKSEVRKKFDGQITRDQRIDTSFLVPAEIKENEELTSIVLNENRTELAECESVVSDRKIFYVTDLHLLHRFEEANCYTKEDLTYTMQSIIDNLLKDAMPNGILLIGGDVSSDFSIFKEFVEMLSKSSSGIGYEIKIFFILGNHEFWDFKDESVEEIVSKYRQLISQNNMILLQNDLCIINPNEIRLINEKELLSIEECKLRSILRNASAILFGGVGFSAYNKIYNANSGIYRETILRDDEIIESRKIEAIYDKICKYVPDRKIIIITHMPFEDWHNDSKRQNEYIYVSGHTHRNKFYDDGVIRIYADNQIGYSGKSVRSKYFYYSYGYDWFSEYEDGIYEILRDDYINFCRGKNLQLTFNRDIETLYMLKKQDYYCFIHKTQTGSMTILNGGSRRSIPTRSIEYYYNHMSKMIETIKTPYDKYFSLLNEISKFVRQIGGSGYKHGAIIDIDYYNHLYLNPNDLTVTPYFAYDMIKKYVYSDIPSLLEARIPSLYEKYCKFLESKKNVPSVLRDNGRRSKPKQYESTDIYAASRELRKMQKLNHNILSVWYEQLTDKQLLIED